MIVNGLTPVEREVTEVVADVLNRYRGSNISTEAMTDAIVLRLRTRELLAGGDE